ncbi:MAG: hypothetical protein AAGJ35_05185, partial [Myxococcota bacterium]
IVFFYILLSKDWDILRRMRLVYLSKHISIRASIWIGTLSSLFAVFVIAAPMFRNSKLTTLLAPVWSSRIQWSIAGKAIVFTPLNWLKSLCFYLDQNILRPFATLHPKDVAFPNPTYQVRLLIVVGLFLLLWTIFMARGDRRKRLFWPLGIALLFWELITQNGLFPIAFKWGNSLVKGQVQVVYTLALLCLGIPFLRRKDFWMRAFAVLGGGVLGYSALRAIPQHAGWINSLQKSTQLLFYQNGTYWSLFVLGMLAGLVFFVLRDAPDAQGASHPNTPHLEREHLKAFLFPGMLLYLVIAGTWTYYMNLHHGFPFMREWFVYHHFSRVAGVIEKPNDSFDLYIKQIAFGMFPWSAIIPVALFRYLQWNWKDFRSQAGLRNYFFFCCFFFPYFFLSFSSTKFHHYIFPTVPFLAIIVANWIARLFDKDGVEKERFGLLISLLFFALLAKDLITNFKPLHQLFTYYYTRKTPPEVFPKHYFTLVFALIGFGWLLTILSRRMRAGHFALIFIPVTLFMYFVNIRMIPAIGQNYSFKSVFEAYWKLDKHKQKKKRQQKKTPLGEFSNWDERSTSFYTKNFSTYLGTERKAKRFLKRHKRVYIMVSKRKIPSLRRIARSVGRKIYIVARPHYNMVLTSTQPKPGSAGKPSYLLSKMPDLSNRTTQKKHWKRVNINFAGKIKMIGVWQNQPKGYRRGDKVELRFLYRVLKPLRYDWKAFVHAEPVKWTRNRVQWDHELAEGNYPTSEWKPGELIQDVIVRRIPR